ncbi:MAG: 1-deoxy-D-xylulose-5-phosphate reductoisomerase [Desulfuromonadales bacterium]|nr:1-deoxy-D-xylulose-5-phosphate reductoisomerase [Desulfuromonadales bacterium]
MKRLAILGSTGVIGVKTLEIAAAYPEQFRVVALTGGRNLDLLSRQVELFRPDLVAVPSAEDAARLEAGLSGVSPTVLHGTAGLIACAAQSDADMVVSAIVGAAGLEPTLAAIEAGRDVALANKETLVIAGQLMTRALTRHGARLLPVDSEHSAIFQSLQGHRKADVRRLVLTASGGPFRNRPRHELHSVSPADALAHPNWSMGRKITIDSATMMNKGLEVIEACWLFDLPVERIAVLIHPESIVHSMVEYVDGAVMAQLGIPEMKTPIAYALSYPVRLPLDLPPLDLCRLNGLHFEEPDRERFPCLQLAYDALRTGGTAPAVLNAANEEAVAAFLEGGIGFMAIARIIASALEDHSVEPADRLDAILAADDWARRHARDLIATLKGGKGI